MENEQEQVEATGRHEDEMDGVKLENERLMQELKTRDEKIVGLERSLVEAAGEQGVNRKSLEEARQVIVETAVDLSQAIGAYKVMAAQANPGLVTEMITGSTIAEIDGSIKHARGLVEKVRQEINAENMRVRVPAGAPPRAVSDLSALSPRDKIKFAVEGR